MPQDAMTATRLRRQTFFRTQPIYCRAPSHECQPGRGADAFPAEMRCLVAKAKKDFLENFLGLLPLHQNPPKHRQESGRKAVVLDSQGLLIVPGNAGQ